MKTISIKCQGSHLAKLEDLKEFQGELKSLSVKNFNKFKKNMLELGYSSPIHVWENDGSLFITDGHQRLRVLNALKLEGYFIPELPVVKVEATDIKEAKKKVLALCSSYGEMSQESLFEFATMSEIDFGFMSETFTLPDSSIDFDSFEENFSEKPQDLEKEEKPKCPTCGK